jgi:hypothetical protein
VARASNTPQRHEYYGRRTEASVLHLARSRLLSDNGYVSEQYGYVDVG